MDSVNYTPWITENDSMPRSMRYPVLFAVSWKHQYLIVVLQAIIIISIACSMPNAAEFQSAVRKDLVTIFKSLRIHNARLIVGQFQRTHSLCHCLCIHKLQSAHRGKILLVFDPRWRASTMPMYSETPIEHKLYSNPPYSACLGEVMSTHDVSKKWYAKNFRNAWFYGLADMVKMSAWNWCQ